VRLPDVLPPSFKGVSTRYAYTLQATAHFKPPAADARAPRPPPAGAPELAGAGETPSPTGSELSLASTAGGARAAPGEAGAPPGRAGPANGLPPRPGAWGWGFGSYSSTLPVAAAAAAAAAASARAPADGEAAAPGGGGGGGALGWRQAVARAPVHLWPPWVRAWGCGARRARLPRHAAGSAAAHGAT